LFPLTEKSRFNPKSPILTEQDIYSFRASQEVTQNLICSLKLMLGFYGLKVQESNLIISINEDSFTERKKQWLHWGNHNHMRITRILKSLSLLGLEEYSKAFFDCLQQIYITEKGSITKLTFSYWEEASKSV
jgi:Opioid growth factor receptor (OGFr) conserved region